MVFIVFDVPWGIFWVFPPFNGSASAHFRRVFSSHALFSFTNPFHPEGVGE